MKKVYGLLSISLLMLTAHAGRIQLKDGTFVDIPDKISILNDLKEQAFVEERVGYPTPTSEARDVDGKELASGEEAVFNVNSGPVPAHSSSYIGVVVNARKYYLDYPTYYHSNADQKPPIEVMLTLKYKLSDILAGKKDSNGLNIPFNT